MSSAVSEKGLQEGDVNALCARIASSEAEGSNGSQQLHGVTASDAMDILLQRFLDLGQGGIPQVSDKMVGFFELEGSLAQLARFVSCPVECCTDRESQQESNKSLTRSYRAMKLLCGAVQKIEPSIQHHLEGIMDVLFLALQNTDRANLHHFKDVLASFFRVYGQRTIEKVKQIPGVIHLFVHSMRFIQVQNVFLTLLGNQDFRIFLCEHGFMKRMELEIGTVDPLEAKEMTAFYLYLFECTQKGMPGFEEFQGEFNKENHLLQLFRQSIDRNSASIVTLCDLLIHVVRIENVPPSFSTTISKYLLGEKKLRKKAREESLVRLSAYTVESFTIRRMTMVRMLRQLVCESPIEDEVIGFVPPEMWQCLTDWFFSYKFNNIFHCHFYALYQELLQRGGWNRLNIIKNTKLVSRMVKEYDPEAKIDNRGHIIYLAKLLMDCEDARVQFYLQGHCHWREFLPIVEQVLEQHAKRPDKIAPRRKKGSTAVASSEPTAASNSENKDPQGQSVMTGTPLPDGKTKRRAITKSLQGMHNLSVTVTSLEKSASSDEEDEGERRVTKSALIPAPIGNSKTNARAILGECSSLPGNTAASSSRGMSQFEALQGIFKRQKEQLLKKQEGSIRGGSGSSATLVGQ